MSFKGKTVLVTGASSGIGASIAKLFAREGANVGIVGRNEEKLKAVFDECSKLGGTPLKLKYDISKEDEAKSALRDTLENFKCLDVLVNNAGIVRLAGVLDGNILQAYDEVMNTNMRAVIHLTHLAAPHLIKVKGNIINISSIGSKKVPQAPAFMPYSVSKAALDHFTKCVAAELAPHGVRVNVVNPGPVKTDITENTGFDAKTSDNFWQKMKEATLLSRVSDPDEIAELVLLLASDKARGITGSSFISDNGMTIK